MFVDSHAHLDGKQFDSDREQVIARAREAGVQTMVAIGNGDGPADARLRNSARGQVCLHVRDHRHSSARSAACGRSCLRDDGATGAASQGHCLGRDRAGLSLRSLSARNAEAGLRAADGIGGRGEAAHRDSLPAFRRQRQRVGRLPWADQRSVGAERVLAAFCTASPGTGLRPSARSTWDS